jgi:hypothetical protein
VPPAFVQSVFVLQPVQAHLFGGPSAIGFSRHFEIVGKLLDREVSNRNFTNISTRHPRLGQRPQTSTDRGGLDPRRDQPEGDWGTSPYIVCEAHGSSRVFESVSSNIAPLTRQSSQPHLQTTSVNCRFLAPECGSGVRDAADIAAVADCKRPARSLRLCPDGNSAGPRRRSRRSQDDLMPAG